MMVVAKVAVLVGVPSDFCGDVGEDASIGGGTCIVGSKGSGAWVENISGVGRILSVQAASVLVAGWSRLSTELSLSLFSSGITHLVNLAEELHWAVLWHMYNLEKLLLLF